MKCDLQLKEKRHNKPPPEKYLSDHVTQQSRLKLTKVTTNKTKRVGKLELGYNNLVKATVGFILENSSEYQSALPVFLFLYKFVPSGFWLTIMSFQKSPISESHYLSFSS